MTVTKRDYSVAIWSMLILSAIFLTGALVGYIYRPRVVHEFVVVVDISSYDVEFNLYKWKNDLRVKKTAKVEKKYTFSCDINVHVRNLDLDNLRSKTFRCLRSLTLELEDFELYNSTFFIYGTELTRLLCKTDRSKCNNVFAIVAEVLSAFNMRISHHNIRALSGYQEALFGWVSVNEYFNKLDGINSDTRLFGGLDMKNYSLLISFEDKKKKQLSPYFDGTKYTIYGNSHTIHGIDMMCYGLSQAFNASLVYLMKNIGIKNTNIRHPCLPSNYNDKILTANVFTQCVREPETTLKDSYKVVGTWNLEECKKLIIKTLDDINRDHSVNISTIISDFNFSNQSFFGFSRISELAASISFDKLNLTSLYKDVLKLCGTNKKTKVRSICFDTVYTYVLIVDQLKISGDNVLIGHKESIETVSGSIVCNSRSLGPRRCACIIGNFGTMSMMFSVSIFSGLAILLIYKRITNNKKQNIY